MTQRRSEIIQDIGLCLCLCYVESFAAMQFSTVDLVLWSEILDFSWTLIFYFLMPVYISGSYWKIFKGNVYQSTDQSFSFDFWQWRLGWLLDHFQCGHQHWLQLPPNACPPPAGPGGWRVPHCPPPTLQVPPPPASRQLWPRRDGFWLDRCGIRGGSLHALCLWVIAEKLPPCQGNIALLLVSIQYLLTYK